MADGPTTPGGSGFARVPSGGLVLGAIASVQFGSSLAVTLFERIGSSGTVLLRLASAAIVLGVLWRPRLRDRGRRELLLIGAFGLVLAGMNLSFYAAAGRIPLGIAVAVEFLGPLAVAVAGSRRRLDFLWIGLAGAGVLALTRGGSDHLDGIGLALALLAGCMWAAYIVLNARLGRSTAGGSALALSMCVAAVVALPLGVASAGGHLLDVESLAVGAAVGLLSSAIPYSLELEALRRIEPAVFGVLMSVEPAFAALAGFLVLGQSLGAQALLGIALVVAASVGVARRGRAVPVPV
ncbi:MAG TPA: EamA family transporter [Solirubrobacteraceae bacterium]|jgi:inner membrane transporter RhtA